MAAIIRHRCLFNYLFRQNTNNLTSAAVTVNGNRSYATKAEKRRGIDRKPTPKIISTAESIAAKGFLRAQKEYFPPADVDSKLNSICQSILGHSDQDKPINDLADRFRLFTACEREFQHAIPNSLLYSMVTLADVRQFYSTPVDMRTPLDRMQNMDLPENIHVQYEYHRFHPDTDTMFNGQTAFNESSTIVTGLKYKNKYPGHVQKQKPPKI